MSISAQQPPTQRSGLRPPADGASPLEATPPATSRFPLVTAEPVRWTEAAAALVGLGTAAAGATWLHPGWDGLTWAVAVLTAAAVVIVGLWGWRTNQRRRILVDLSNRTGYLLKTPVQVSWARWSRGLVGEPVKIRIDSSEQAAIGYGDRLPAQLAQATSRTLGGRFLVVRHDQRRSRTTLRAVSVQREKPTALELAQQRVRDVVAETFGADATVDAFDTSPGDEASVTAFTVHYKAAAAKLTVPAIRRRITNAVGDRLDGRWKANFALQEDRVTYSRRPPLPTFYPRPTTPVPERADPAYNLIPQAVDEDGQILNWDISGVMAHLLRCGKTRSGKTVSLIGDAIEMARRGFRVLVLDPKRTEFLGLRNWPNVELVATRVPDQVALVHQIWLEMEDRYRRIEEDGADESDFDPILLIIDEYRQMHANVKAWWSGIKVTGMPSECPVFEEIGSLLRMAAACRIHVDLATQRPDAEFLKGETRDNFAARAAAGRLSPDGAQMMFDSQHVGVAIPLNVRGRGTMTGMDDRPREVQFLYTPDPRRARSPEDTALLDALRPPTTRWPRMAVELPPAAEVAEALDGKKTSVEWEQLLRATLVPFDPSTEPDADDLEDLEDLDDDDGTGQEADLIDDEPADEPVDEVARARRNAQARRAATHPGQQAQDDQSTAHEHGDDPDEDTQYNGVSVEGYDEPVLVRVDAVEVGDLIRVQDDGPWVCVEQVDQIEDAFGGGQVQLDWRDDDDNAGEQLVSAEELTQVRRPLD